MIPRGASEVTEESQLAAGQEWRRTEAGWEEEAGPKAGERCCSLLVCQATVPKLFGSRADRKREQWLLDERGTHL